MKRRLAVLSVLSVLVLALALACRPGREPGVESPQQPSGSGEVAARVNGEPIYVDELDDFIKDSLFEEETRGGNRAKLYEVRRQAIGALIREKFITAEAERRGTTPEALIEAEAAALGPVSDEEIESFFEENKERIGDRPLEELRDRIRDYLETQRSAQAVQNLEKSLQVQMMLEPPRFEVSAEGPSAGPDDAPVTIVEFSDFQCPFCRRASTIVREVRERYPQQVRLVYRHFPLEHIHSDARAAAEASMCAADQGEFWGYHDALFENARALGQEDLIRYAGDLELDVEAFEQCLEDRTHRTLVDADLAEGRDLGVTGTPAFFVNGVMMTGAKPVESFTALIDAELERLGGEQGEQG
jgi:protein-disulfide isomerase